MEYELGVRTHSDGVHLSHPFEAKSFKVLMPTSPLFSRLSNRAQFPTGSRTALMKETISPVRNWMYSGLGALGSFGQNWANCGCLIKSTNKNKDKINIQTMQR